MKQYFIIPILYFFISTTLFAQTALTGKVTEVDNKEPVLFGTVALFQNGTATSVVETDFDGNYTFSSINPGIYYVEASYIGLKTKLITGVIVHEGKTNLLNIQLNSINLESPEIEVIEYKVPIIEKSKGGGIVSPNQIRTLPTKSVNGLAATVIGINSADDGANLGTRCSRCNSTHYYINGISTKKNRRPSTIDDLQIKLGGLEADKSH